MFDEAMLVLGQIGVVAVLGGLGAVLFRRSFQWRWFAGALALYFLYDFLLTRGFYLIPSLPEGASWNWLGKAMSLAGMLAIAALPVMGWRRCGITLKQGEGWLRAFVVFVVLSAVVFYFAVTTGDGAPDDAETIAYQWTMPGLDEEVFYRGVLLLAMNEAFRARANILGAPIGYGGLLTSVLFGLAHGMDFGAQGFSFDAMTFAMTGAPALILLWMRERSGSVVIPILAHNVVNGAFTLF